MCNWFKGGVKKVFKVWSGNQVDFFNFSENSFDQLFQNTSKKEGFSCFLNENETLRWVHYR